MQMSFVAWETLAQLAGGPCHDGELVSKMGRSELVRLGLVVRGRRCPGCQLSLNELTQRGASLSIHCPVIDIATRDWWQ